MIHFRNGDTLPPFDHPYNTTALNERAVELAMASYFLALRIVEGSLGRCLEVGNVLSHYELSPGGRIVDRFEEAPGVENIDVFDIEGTYDTIVSISTIEHVGVDDGRRDSAKALDAIDHLRSLLAADGRFFCTFPTGWNYALDCYLRGGAISRRALKENYQMRQGDDWHERDGNAFGGYNPLPYGTSTRWAEGVWVGEFGPL